MSGLKKFTDFEVSLEEQSRLEKSTDYKAAKKRLLKLPFDKIEEIKDRGDDLVSIIIKNSSEMPILVKIIGFDLE